MTNRDDPIGAPWASPASSASIPTVQRGATGWEPVGKRVWAPKTSWPEAATEDVFLGLAGDFVRAVEPASEADPIALLVQYLTAFGNMIGREPHFVAEADRHPANLYVALVGPTAKARKGSSWGHVRRVFEMVDPPWATTRILSGLSSGEGLIHAVRDPSKAGGRSEAGEDPRRCAEARRQQWR